MSEVRITREAQMEIAALPTPIKDRVLALFERLAAWPDVSGVKPLRGELAGHTGSAQATTACSSR